MLGKRTRPEAIKKLPEPFISGGGIPSPKCSLEFRILSPRSLKCSDPAVGIGLGIVAALEKSGQPIKDVAVGSSVSSRSNPIPINGSVPQQPESYVKCIESYTTYCEDVGVAGHDRKDMKWKKSTTVFYESPPPAPRIMGASRLFPALDFLSSCHLCRKKLHGKDIYMYRGEKAFCSPECRCRQIAMDERKEKCGSGVSRSLDVSSSPYSRENIFFTEIIAA